MIDIEKKLNKFFRNNPVHEDKPKLRSGKLPIGQLYKILGENGREDLKLYINKEEVKEKLSATKLRLFKLGHLIEEYMINLMEEGSLHIEDEQLTLENDFLKGKIDFTIKCDKGKKYICDIKSMSDMNYGLLLQDVVPEHIKVQLMCYIWLWREMWDEKIEDDAIIIAYNKNDSRVKVYIVKYDDIFIKTYLMEAKKFYYKVNKE